LRKNKFTTYYTSLFAICINCIAITIHADPVSPVPTPPTYENLTEQIQTKVNALIAERLSKQRTLINNDAVVAVAMINEAVLLLETGSTVIAKKRLHSALTRLNRLIRNNPALRFAPILVSHILNDELNSYDVIQYKKQEINKQWQLGHAQKVRRMLNDFINDTTIRTLSIPIEQLYQMIQESRQLIILGQIEKAKLRIEALLKSIVISEHTIPFPLLRAELLIDQAEQITQQADNTNQNQPDSAVLQSLLSHAKYQLKLANALGYGSSERYRIFYQAIDGIKSLVNANQQTTKLFSKLRFAILNLKNEIIEDK